MIEKVKSKLKGSKEPLEPISLRIERSSKIAISLLAKKYGVNPNLLIRHILQTFIDEYTDEAI